MKQVRLKATKKEIIKSVASSSRIEGLSFFSARKNKKAIKILRHYDRAFSL